MKGKMMSKGVTISFYGTNELKERLDRTAKKQDRSASSVIRRALDLYLEHPGYALNPKPAQDVLDERYSATRLQDR